MLALHLKPLATLVNVFHLTVNPLTSPCNYTLRRDGRNDSIIESLSKTERDCPSPSPICGATVVEPMLLTARPGHEVSPWKHWLWKDPGRGQSC